MNGEVCVRISSCAKAKAKANQKEVPASSCQVDPVSDSLSGRHIVGVRVGVVDGDLSMTCDNDYCLVGEIMEDEIVVEAL